MFERFLGKKTSTSENVKRQEDAFTVIDPNIREGHAYLLVGGKTDDLLTNCDNCGGPYKGPCQPNCEFCSSQRKVFYADITNAQLVSEINSTNSKEISLLIPSGDSAEFDSYTSVDIVVAEEITSNEEFTANLIITKRFKSGSNANIGTLILVDDGEAVLEDDCEIDTLITGRNSSLKAGDYMTINKLLKSSALSYKTGMDFSINTTKIISTTEFLSEIVRSTRK